ncbi:hypothetical protein ACHHYP_17224 [Achlya hypogyna]|uniref:Uncharacterized protein n=1 Tax=Achlya hypogyna TaxID=1202772 RepID=A0A1V9Y4V8_ACHHY|nr:hypothetical protein ACHHYP_17224 [Achlya hypogyna]
MAGRYLAADAADLIAKGQLTQDEWQAMQRDGGAVVHLRTRMMAQLERETEAAIASQPKDQVLESDVVAAVGGALWGAASAWLKSATKPPHEAPASTTSFLWSTAKEAALKSMETSQKIRRVEFLKLEHYCGDVASAEHVIITVNGFMTHGADPSANWAAFCERKHVACYVVQWEAGSEAEWNDFVGESHAHLGAGQEDAIASHFTGNPWNKAQNKATQVGHILADVLRSQPTALRGRKVTLMGHSLGGAVIASLLERLSAQNRANPSTRFLLHHVVLFAAAFVPEHNFTAVAADVFPDARRRILNVYSTQDHVLLHLFWAVNLHKQRPAAGCVAIASPTVENIDVSAHLPAEKGTLFGHSYEGIMGVACDKLDAFWDLPNA